MFGDERLGNLCTTEGTGSHPDVLTGTVRLEVGVSPQSPGQGVRVLLRCQGGSSLTTPQTGASRQGGLWAGLEGLEGV